jgi:hypothetical protein
MAWQELKWILPLVLLFVPWNALIDLARKEVK